VVTPDNYGAARERIPIHVLDRIIADMPNRPEIQYTGSKAFYCSLTDRVTLPPRELFTSAEEFYATALHETVHSSGSENALREKEFAKPLRSVRPSIPRRSL
jgi:antirestriction protein ArdC